MFLRIAFRALVGTLGDLAFKQSRHGKIVTVDRNPMKRLLMGLMLLVTATATSAGWTQVGEGDAFVQYVDRATIRRNGNFVKMWDLADYNTVQTVGSVPYLSQKEYYEYDCKEERVRMLSFIWTDGKMGNGKVVSVVDETGSNWFPVSPRTFAEKLWKIACGKK